MQISAENMAAHKQLDSNERDNIQIHDYGTLGCGPRPASGVIVNRLGPLKRPTRRQCFNSTDTFGYKLLYSILISIKQIR